jgi:hypothetical protein
MKVYPYNTTDEIIELVEKRELDEMTFLAHDLASQVSDFGALVDKLERELRDAVKRMEEVPVQELDRIWDATGECALDGLEGVRARLIQAAKGEQL